MRRALAVAVALGGCGGGAGYADWSTARAHVPSAEDTAPRLAIAPLVVLAPGASAPLAVLGEGGALTGPGCELVVSADGGVRERSSDAVVLRLGDDDHVLDASGAMRFRLEDARLVRPDGSAAIIDGTEVRFDESPGLALRVEGAEDEALRQTALIVVAALSTCR